MSAIGLLHPGEMGAALGEGWSSAGHRVGWASAGRSTDTVARAAAAGLVDHGDLADLAARSEILVSVCPPHGAEAVAAAVAATGFGGTYLDANAISPATATRVALAVSSGGARFVDGGIVGPPPRVAGSTRLYLSGPGALELTAVLATERLEVHVVSDAIGAASALKLTYAAWTKGSAALLVAIRAAAVSQGVEAALVEEWRTSQPGLVDRSAAAARSGAAKGWRWAGEMEEIAAMFEGLGLPGGFHHGAAAVFRDLPWRPPSPE